MYDFWSASLESKMLRALCSSISWKRVKVQILKMWSKIEASRTNSCLSVNILRMPHQRGTDRIDWREYEIGNYNWTWTTEIWPRRNVRWGHLHLHVKILQLKTSLCAIFRSEAIVAHNYLCMSIRLNTWERKVSLEKWSYTLLESSELDVSCGR